MTLELNHSMEREIHLIMITILLLLFKIDSSPLSSEKDLMLRVSSKIKIDTITSSALQNNLNKQLLFWAFPSMMLIPKQLWTCMQINLETLNILDFCQTVTSYRTLSMKLTLVLNLPIEIPTLISLDLEILTH